MNVNEYSAVPWQPPPPVIIPPPAAPSGLSVASMVLGILTLPFFWWGLATLAMVVLAITFGAIGIGRPGGRGMATAGLVLGSVGALIYLIWGLFTLGVGLLV